MVSVSDIGNPTNKWRLLSLDELTPIIELEASITS